LLGLHRSLRPFPFHTSQYSLYTNMVPVGLMMCNESQAPDMQNRFVPKAHPEDSGTCGMVYSDEQLVRRCRARTKGQFLNTEALADRVARYRAIQCPAVGEIKVDMELDQKIRKYVARSEALHCQTHKGMWNQEMSDQHKCVLTTIAHFLGFRPGELVFDWGSGCGHKLSWAKMLFDVDGLGLDIMGAAVAWAHQHSAGSFCHADGRDLRWVPDGVFDYVISYAAIYHLSKTDQCHTGLQLVSKLRVGGKAFLGWNHGPNMSNWEWLACFRGAGAMYAEQGDASSWLTPPGYDGPGGEEFWPGLPGAIAAANSGVQVEMEAIEDGFLFPPDARKVSGNKSFLFQYPAYSLFLTRVA